MGRYASAPNLPGLLPSDSSSLEGQQPADLPAGETRHCLSAKPHMHTAVRGPPATVSACGRTIRSQMGIALNDSMHSAAVLPCIRALQVACCMPRDAPSSWQTHAHIADSSSSKPWGLLSLLQRSDCHPPGPALRQHVSLSRPAWPGRRLRLPHRRPVLDILLRLLQPQMCTPHLK